MYPITICFVRDRNGLQYVWLDQGFLGEQNKNFAPRAKELALTVAQAIWEHDKQEARACQKDRGRISNLIEFGHLPEVRKFNNIDHPQVLALKPRQQKLFLCLVQRGFEKLKGRYTT